MENPLAKVIYKMGSNLLYFRLNGKAIEFLRLIEDFQRIIFDNFLIEAVNMSVKTNKGVLRKFWNRCSTEEILT